MSNPSKLAEYKLQIGPNNNLYIAVKGKPHLAYTIAAFQQLIAKGLITK